MFFRSSGEDCFSVHALFSDLFTGPGVGYFNLRAHFFQAFTLIHQLHQVTRDAYADDRIQFPGMESFLI